MFSQHFHGLIGFFNCYYMNLFVVSYENFPTGPSGLNKPAVSGSVIQSLIHQKMRRPLLYSTSSSWDSSRQSCTILLGYRFKYMEKPFSGFLKDFHLKFLQWFLFEIHSYVFFFLNFPVVFTKVSCV